MTTETSPGLPPQLALYHLATGHYLSHALSLAAKLGIADLLADGPRHSNDLAEATRTNAQALNRVLRLLATAGVFAEQEDGAFVLTPIGAALRAGVPASARVDESLASRGAAKNDVNMLVNTGGRQRSEAEFRLLYEAAGLQLQRIVPTEARVSVIEGTPAL